MSSSIDDGFEPASQVATFAICAAVIILFAVDHFVDTSTPFFASIVAGTITILVGFLWQFRKRPLFWIIMLIISALHVLLLFEIPLPHKVSYGFLFMPVVFAEIAILYRLIWKILSVKRRD